MSAPRAAGTIATILVQGLDMGAQVIVGVLVARGLGPGAMGDFTFAYAVAGVLSIVLLFGTAEIAIPLYAAREVPARLVLGATLRRLARGSAWCVALAGVLLLALQVSLPTALAVGLSVAALLANGLSSTANAAILGLGLSMKDLPWVVLTRGLLVSVALVGVELGSLPLVLVGGLVSAAGLALARVALVHRRGSEGSSLWRDGVRSARGEAAALDRMFRTRSAPVGLSGVFGMVSARSDMFLLQKLASAEVVGQYGAAYRIINGLLAGTNALVIALYPRLASPDLSVRRAAQRAFVWLPATIGGVLLLSSAFAGEVLTLLYGPAFAPAAWLFRVLLIAASVQVVLCFLSRYVVASGRERVMPWAQGAAAVMNLLTNLLFIPSMGGGGAAVATLCAESTALATYLFQLWRGRTRGPVLAAVYRSGTA